MEAADSLRAPPSTGGCRWRQILFSRRLPERPKVRGIMKANWVVWPLPSFVLALVPLDYRACSSRSTTVVWTRTAVAPADAGARV